METDSPRSGREKKKSFNWLRIIASFVVLIIIGASIAYIDHKINKTNSSTSSSSSSNKQFNAVPNASEPLVITINTRAQGDNTGNTSIDQTDGRGNYQQSNYFSGKVVTTIYTPNAFYVCNNTSSPCIKYPNSDITTPSDGPNGFVYTTAKIKILKGSATYQGQQKCPVGSGNCDVWLYGPNKVVDMKLFYVNTANKNIVAVIDTGHFGGTEIVTHIAYVYKAVSITVPTNYTNAPSQSQ